VHNTRPHEPGSRVEGALLRWCDRSTTLQVRLNEEIPSPLRAPEQVILLAHYGGWYRHRTVPRSVHGRLLYFGLVRPYKGVPQLLDAFEGIDDAGVSLRIVGSCDDADLEARILAGVAGNSRVSAELSYVDDDALAHEIGQAELVVLPYLAMGNSGALLTALCLDRPVLAPATPTSRALATEVGDGWVITYEGSLTPQHLVDGLTAVRAAGRAASPDLSRRDWSVVGPQHLDAYARAVRIARGLERRPR
jgi:beta-1,4-mannosyltransferase